MPCITAPASASAGIALGEVKLVTSMRAKPQSDSASMKAILSSVGTMRASICKPSRGPTSLISRTGEPVFMGASSLPGSGN